MLGFRSFGMGLGLGTLGVVGSSASKSVGINRREPPKLGNAGTQPLVVERGSRRNAPLPTCHSAEFGRSRSNGTSVI